MKTSILILNRIIDAHSKILLLFILFVLPVILNAQSSDSTFYKNELGTDLTALMERFINFNQNESFVPEEITYQLTYKRHFNKFSIRAGFGGSSNTRHEDIINSIDTARIKISTINFNYRLGLEKSSTISKRWNFIYGLDLRYEHFKSYTGKAYYYESYRVARDNKTQSFGLAPMIGLEFKINKMISIHTEASLYLFATKVKNKETSTPLVPDPVLPPNDKPDFNKMEFENQFLIPNFLVISIKI